ncbi:hypothetical protein HKX48_002467 [Thoreauomyces humboldtii]|nr:hypothetical protein HKX48_002467 [Thoreauomyces humboldtii]
MTFEKSFIGTATIIGLGVAGPVLALRLKSLGWNVKIYEKVEEIKDVGGSLCLARNGLQALASVGLVDEIIRTGAPMTGAMHATTEGETLFRHDFSSGETTTSPFFVGIKRSGLQRILVEAVRAAGIPVFFGKSFATVEGHSDADTGVTAVFADGERVVSQLLFACDGLHSAVRKNLFGEDRPAFTGLTQTIGLSPIPSGRNMGPRMVNVYGNSLHFITYRADSSLQSWAVTSRSETEDRESWKAVSLDQAAQLLRKVEPWKNFPQVAELVRTSDRLMQVGLYDRPPLTKWNVGRVILVGDAAHPTSPHLGQGANQAMEDCSYIHALLARIDSKVALDLASINDLFRQYSTDRIERTSLLVKGARAQGESRVCDSASDMAAARDRQLRAMTGDELESTLRKLWTEKLPDSIS